MHVCEHVREWVQREPAAPADQEQERLGSRRLDDAGERGMRRLAREAGSEAHAGLRRVGLPHVQRPAERHPGDALRARGKAARLLQPGGLQVALAEGGPQLGRQLARRAQAVRARREPVIGRRLLGWGLHAHPLLRERSGAGHAWSKGREGGRVA